MSATSLMITDHEMQTAAGNDQARQLCRDVPEIRKCHDHWWLASPEGWLRITDCYLAERLDQIRQRLDETTHAVVGQISRQPEAA
jgi:hypothetical protein